MYESKDLGAIKAKIASKNGDSSATRSLKREKNLTARVDLDQIVPVNDRILVTLKSWPAQTSSGIIVPDSFTVIRNEMYITQVEKVGKDVKTVNKGDVVVASMYSGFHLTTKTGHAKMLSEADILIYKTKKEMEKNKSFSPKTFKPGINHILIKMISSEETVTEGGIITEVGDDSAFNKTDVATKSGVVLAVGPTNKYGHTFSEKEIVGKTIVIDAYVGMTMNTPDTTESGDYRVMLGMDILGFIEEKK